MKKLFFPIASAVTVALSTVALIDYSVRKSKKKTAYAGELILGLVGLATGTALAVYPSQKEAASLLALHDMLDDEDVALMDRNIAEVLGRTADVDIAKKAPHRRQIELDDETSEADFV